MAKKNDSLFKWLDSILENKTDLIANGQFREDDYSRIKFQINRGLSQQVDCVLYADEMNCFHHLDGQMQYDYLLNAIPAKRRKMVKWARADKNEEDEAISFWFGINRTRAAEYRKILGDEKTQLIMRKVESLSK